MAEKIKYINGEVLDHTLEELSKIIKKNQLTLPLGVDKGGTGAVDKAGARENLGIGSVGTLNYGSSTLTYLRNDGTWQTPVNTWIAFAGASSSFAGTAGYVPAPGIGNQNKYLRGDGTWQTPPDNNTWVPFKGATADNPGTAGYISTVPTAGQTGLYFKSDGTWGTPTNTTYNVFGKSTTTANGTTGLVPAPTAGADNRYLRNDGTWQVPPTSSYGLASTSNSGLAPKLSGVQTEYLNGNGNWTTPPDTKYSAFAGSTSGLVPTSDGTATKYLNGAGNWTTPPNTNTWTAFVGASTTSAGTAGYVPAPGTGNQEKFFKADGTWATPINTTYNVTSTNAAGLAPQLNGTATMYLNGAGQWATPPNTNNAVTQTISATENAAYRVLFSNTADDTTRTEGARKAASLTFNPSTGELKATTFTGNFNGSISSADKLTNAQTISLTGNVTGSASFTGNSACSIAATIANSAVTLGKLGSDVITAYVGSTQPTDSHVQIWIDTSS